MLFDFKFDWASNLETGVDYIDLQHKQLLHIGRDIEQLILIQCIGVTPKQLLDIVCSLREYAAYHFYEEESLMEAANYKKLKQHHLLHLKMQNNIMAIDCKMLAKNPLPEIKKLKEMLQDYIFEHILKTDAEMVQEIGIDTLNKIIKSTNREKEDVKELDP